MLSPLKNGAMIFIYKVEYHTKDFRLIFADHFIHKKRVVLDYSFFILIFNYLFSMNYLFSNVATLSTSIFQP